MIQNKRPDERVAESREYHKELSEIDVILRALDRFFSIENLPISPDELGARNFSGELMIVRDGALRVLALIETILPEERKNAYWFQKFTESKLLSDRSRDEFRKRLYREDTPESALYILYDLFVHLKGIVNDLLKSDHISYISYANVGHLLKREIRAIHSFDPFRMDINPRLDVIECREISEIVKSIADPASKKSVSLLFLYLFRSLRFLRHAEVSSCDAVLLHSALLILILMRSELNTAINYIKAATGREHEEELKGLLRSISYQFSMERKRVYLQELRNILGDKAADYLRGKIENSRGILENLIEQSVVQIAQYFKPGLEGRDIFESFTARVHESVRIREDISVLRRFLVLYEDKSRFPEEAARIYRSMKMFMHYFEGHSFRFLRYDDYDFFVSFFQEILALKDDEVRARLDQIHTFRIFLETTLRLIEQRAELKDNPLREERTENIVKQYLE